MPDRLRVWQGVAERRGGTASVTTDLGHSDFELRLDLPHTRLVVRGRNHPYRPTGDFIVAAARADGATGLALSIQPKKWMRGLGLSRWRDFGLYDIERLDPLGYRVRCNDLGLAGAWLAADLVPVLEVGPVCTARVHRGRVQVGYPGHFSRQEHELERIIALTEGLSSERAGALRQSWIALATQLGARVESTEIDALAARMIEVGDVVPRFECTRPPPIHIDRSPHQLRIDGVQRSLTGRRRDRSLWTVLRAPRRDHGTGRLAIASAGAPWFARASGYGRYTNTDIQGFRLLVAASTPADIEERCARLAAKLWPAVGPDAVVLVDRDVEVLWPGLQTDFGAVEAGIALTTALAAATALQDGPYR